MKEQQLKQLVDEKVSLTKLLKKINPSQHYEVGQTCFCPFHDNHDTPAASIYEDNGNESLYCFSERKLYKPSDAIERLLHQDVYSIAQTIWNSLTPDEQAIWLSQHSNSYEDEFSRVEKHNETLSVAKQNFYKVADEFKYKEVSAIQVIEAFYDTL